MKDCNTIFAEFGTGVECSWDGSLGGGCGGGGGDFRLGEGLAGHSCFCLNFLCCVPCFLKFFCSDEVWPFLSFLESRAAYVLEVFQLRGSESTWDGNGNGSNWKQQMKF